MEKILFGIHLPVMGFDNTNHEKKGIDESPNTREQMSSIIKKAEFLGYDSLSINDHIVFRTSWLDSLSVLSAAAAVTNKIKIGTSILNIVVRTHVICANALSAIDMLSSGRLFAAGVGPGSLKGTMMYVVFLLNRDGVDLKRH
jgi:alkanesulfonate monooxygenase SsuD/methylene tetrahydromethanopterin reductase-like flavin-dependent oxidoreductase (luciferase family)